MLLRRQYAPVGSAAKAALPEVLAALQSAATLNNEIGPLLERYQQRVQMTDLYVDAYRRYCWPVHSLGDLKLAPFHLLATQGTVHLDKDHVWHMSTLARLCQTDPGFLYPTPYRTLDLTLPDEQAGGTAWWEEITAAGGEGMVVKPFQFMTHGKRGVIQPALKVRGREYLRIIYGPEYTAPENLSRLRARGTSRKRSLALREFVLGLEAMERFVRGEPLRRVHE